MADKEIKAERAALRTLRRAVTSYAERVRESMASARRDADALVKRADAAAAKRKADLDRTLADLNRAEAELARCHDERAAAALAATIDGLRRLADGRRQLYGSARQGAKTAADARSDLLRTIRTLDPVVGQASSVAAHALASLDGRLAAIDLRDPGSARIVRGVRDVAATGALLVDSITGLGHVGQFAQTVKNGYLTDGGHPATSAEVQARQYESAVEYLAVSDLAERERRGQRDGLA